MLEFKIEPGALNETRDAKSRFVLWGIVLLLFAISVSIYALGFLGLLSVHSNLRWLAWLSVPTIFGAGIGTLVLAFREGLRRAEREMIFVLDDNGIVRRRKGYPDVNIAFSEIGAPVNSNWDTVESSYVYAALGVTTTTTMPCATTKQSGCTNGPTTTTHDALGRPLVITDGGGGTITNTYTASTSCTSGLSACLIKLTVLGPAPTGEVVKQVATETDGLGRIVATCAISSNQGGACGFGGYSGILTTVVYNSTGTVASVTKGSQSHSATYDGTGRMITSTTPEGGTKQFFYDSAPSTPGVACTTSGLGAGTFPSTNYAPLGNLVKTYDANGTTTCYSYDKLGRVVAAAYAGTNFDGANKYFIYDSSTVDSVAVGANGHIAEAYTAATISGTKITDEGFLYTVRGELSDIYQWSTNSGTWYHTTATYAANGEPLSLTAANSLLGGAWTYTLDGKGRPITAVQVSTNMVTGVTYNAADQPCVVTLGLGDKDTYQYDGGVNCTSPLYTGRMTQYDFSIKGTPVHFTGTLSWNVNGTLNGLTVVDGINSGADSETCTYANSSGLGYDEFGRLMGVDCINGSTDVWGQNFTYDQYDNLSKSTITGYPGVNWLPTYNSINQYSAATYDSNGNVLTDTFHTYTWNQDNKVKTITDAGVSGVLYDAFGRRVEWLTGSTYSQTLMSPLGPVALLSRGTTTQYRVPLPGGDTAVNGVNFEHSDHLGNIPFVSNRNRTATAARLFAPYGESYNNVGSTGDLVFTGDFQDFVAGVYDTPNRELTPNAGRWATPDPAGASWNAYAYSTNPMGETDPTGLWGISRATQNCPTCWGPFGMNGDGLFGSGYGGGQALDWAGLGLIDEADTTLGSGQSWGGDWSQSGAQVFQGDGFGGSPLVLGLPQADAPGIPGMGFMDNPYGGTWKYTGMGTGLDGGPWTFTPNPPDVYLPPWQDPFRDSKYCRDCGKVIHGASQVSNTALVATGGLALLPFAASVAPYAPEAARTITIVSRTVYLSSTFWHIASDFIQGVTPGGPAPASYAGAAGEVVGSYYDNVTP